METCNSSTTKQDELLQALHHGNVELFRRLLDDKEVRAYFNHYKKRTCLEIACRDNIPNCEEIIKLLLFEKKFKPNVNCLVPEPIHYAVDRGNVTALKLLLRDKRTKINAVTSEGLTPLHFAARNFKNDAEKYSQILELLLDCPTLDINKPNKKGYTAVYEAAHSGCKEAVLKMLQHSRGGFDLDTNRSHGRSARDVILKNFPDVEPLLPLVKFSISDAPEQQLRLLTELLNQQMGPFKRLLQQVDEEGSPLVDPNYNYVKPYPTTCLNEACKKLSMIDFAHVLLHAGADPNLVNTTTRRAPIHVAIFFLNLDAVEVLIEQQPFNANIQDKAGNTPLHYIVNYIQNDQQAEELIDKVLKLRADLTVRNNNNKTAFMDADRKGRKDVIKDMVRERDVNDVVEDGECHTKSLKLRLFHSLDKINFVTFQRLLDEENCETLLDSSHNKNTLLQTACLANLKYAVEMLLIKGANPNLTISTNLTPPLIISANNKQNDIIEKFLAHGHNLHINKVDKNGNTALHIVAQNHNLDMVIKLLNAGAELRMKNNTGRDPITSSVLKEFLDNCLQPDSETLPGDEKYKVKLNYNFLVARKKKEEPQQSATFNRNDEESACLYHRLERTNDEPELNILSYIINSHSEVSIVKHPLITSFINLKWDRLKYLSYLNLFFTLLFTIILNWYIYWGCYLEGSCTYSITILKVIIGVLLIVIILRELLVMLSSVKVYLRNISHKLDMLTMFFTISTIFNPLQDGYVKLGVTVLTVFSSTTRMSLMMISSGFSMMSKYIVILKKVTVNFLYMLILYSIVLLAFTISFYVLFRDTENPMFTNFFLALFNVIMMMSGDLNSDSLEPSSTSVICYVIFAAFGLIVVIVLLNVLTGLAVSDIQEQAASLLSIRSQIKSMTEIEMVVLKCYRWLPPLSRVYSIDNFMVGSKINDDICVYPNRSSNLQVYENKSFKMKHEWLSDIMRIISERSDKSLSVDEQLLKIQGSLQQINNKISEMDRESTV